MLLFDPVEVATKLIRCPSVTPVSAHVMEEVITYLLRLGFACEIKTFEEAGMPPVENLYARYGRFNPNLCFAGHTDVVPVGDVAAWRIDPFRPEVIDGVLYGRGAVDMKGAIACFIAAVSRFLEKNRGMFGGSISLLITGDEEGPAINGTRKMLHYIKEKGEKLDVCLVGEPTNPEKMGDMIKIGRRGSISFTLIITGVQGHVAYPAQADNPITRLVKILVRLKAGELDQGTPYFPPSNLEITTIDVGNPTGNVIPAQAKAQFNIRFNDQHTGESLFAFVKALCEEEAAGRYLLEHHGVAEAFLTQEGKFSQLVTEAVMEVSGKVPELSTTGGTSDARFIKDYCPVVEYGLINQTAHKVDECIAVADLEALTETYVGVLRRYFS